MAKRDTPATLMAGQIEGKTDDSIRRRLSYNSQAFDHARNHDVLQARDADAYDRILLLTDSAWGSPGPPSPRLRAVGAAIAEMWPDARITMLLGTAEAGDQLTGPLLQAGIEVAAEKDWDAWFEARRFHYSTVIVPGAACFERFDPLIAAEQTKAQP